MGWYSSKLNVITFLKLKPSSLCIRISSWYTFFGEEPVANPKTAGLFSFAFCLINAAISKATALDAFSESSKMVVGILSKLIACSIIIYLSSMRPQ